MIIVENTWKRKQTLRDTLTSIWTRLFVLLAVYYFAHFFSLLLNHYYYYYVCSMCWIYTNAILYSLLAINLCLWKEYRSLVVLLGWSVHVTTEEDMEKTCLDLLCRIHCSHAYAAAKMVRSSIIVYVRLIFSSLYYCYGCVYMETTRIEEREREKSYDTTSKRLRWKKLYRTAFFSSTPKNEKE